MAAHAHALLNINLILGMRYIPINLQIDVDLGIPRKKSHKTGNLKNMCGHHNFF